MSQMNRQDMGSGSVKKMLLSMAIPAVVGQVINLMYNIVDRIYIGHIPEIGGTALTGVGLFNLILLLIPLIFLLPQFIEDKVFAVFLAEPVPTFWQPLLVPLLSLPSSVN